VGKYVNYGRDLQSRLDLLNRMPRARFGNWKKIPRGMAHVKADTAYLWYLLATLKEVFGKHRFNRYVGLSHWDIGLVFVVCPGLSLSELKHGLIVMKDLLAQHAVEEPLGTYALQIAKLRFSELWMLYEKGGNWGMHIPEIPSWDAINEDLDLSYLL
jgi:hypothetical protein